MIYQFEIQITVLVKKFLLSQICSSLCYYCCALSYIQQKAILAYFFNKGGSLLVYMLLSHSWDAKPNTVHLAVFKNKVLINIIQANQLLWDSESLFSFNSPAGSQFMYFQ